MKKIKAIWAILILMLTCSAFAQSNEDKEAAAAEHILCYAVANGDEPKFLSIMLYHPPTDLNYSCNEEEHTPLQYATAGGFSFMVETLVKAGASIDPLSLILAINKDYLDIAEFFVSENVNLCIPFPNSKLGQPASRYAQSEEMKTLLKNAEKQADLKTDSVGVCEVRQTDTH